MAIGADDLSSAVGLFDWVKILAVPGISLTAILAAFHFGGRVTGVETAIKSNAADTALNAVAIKANELKQEASVKALEIKTESSITALQLKNETLSRDHTALAVAVAALPTRTEMLTNFEALSREVRNVRPAS